MQLDKHRASKKDPRTLRRCPLKQGFRIANSVVAEDVLFRPVSLIQEFCLLAVFGGPINNLGATVVDTHRIAYGGAFVLEGIGTFFLVNTVLHAAVRGSAGRLAPFAIGMTVTVCILIFGALTGGSVNPARTIGPAVAAGVYDGIAVYLVAQLLGGIVAGVLYRVFWVPRPASARFGTAGHVAAE